MKNYLIKTRYGINKKINYLLKKLILKRKNIFVSNIYINNFFIYNIKTKKNFFLLKKYLFFKIIIICGGDGSFLNEFKCFFNNKVFLKFLNFGNLGFLSNNNLKKNFLLNFNYGNIIIFKNKIISSFIFINEIILKKKNLKIKIKNNFYLIESLIISTSLGSTGYMFSNIKLQLNINYLCCLFNSLHNNRKIFFIFKKIKIKISIINIIIDFNQNFILKNNVLIILIKKKNMINNLKNKIYDK